MVLKLQAGTDEPVEIANLPDSDSQIASNTASLSMNILNKNIRDIIEAPEGSKLQIIVAGTSPPDVVMVEAKIRYRVGVGIR